MTPQTARSRARTCFALMLAGALCAPLTVTASGTLGAGSGGSPFALGKRIYLQRIACADCPAPGGASSADAARALVDRVESDEFALKPRERRAVVAYLNRRWRLQ